MADGVKSQADGGVIRYLAAGDVSLGGLLATGGSVSVIATAGDILDLGDAHKDIVANEARLVAGSGIGESGDHLEIAVATVAAQAAGDGIYLLDDDAIAVGAVGPVAYHRVAGAGASSVQTDAQLTGARTTAGDGAIVVGTVAGGVTVSQSIVAHGAGNILLRAVGATSDIALTAPVSTSTGSISVIADRNVRQEVKGDLTVGGTGTIDVEAAGGTIVMVDDEAAVNPDSATATTAGGSILYVAEGDITVGGLNGGATGAIQIDSASGSVLDAGDTEVDVTAMTVRFTAGNGVGNGDALDLAVDVLAARAGNGGVFLIDRDAVTVGSVVGAQVSRVAATGMVSDHPVAAAADLVGVMTTAVAPGIGVFVSAVDGVTANGAAAANASLKLISTGAINDLLFEARATGVEWNGAEIRIEDDAAIVGNDAEVRFYDEANPLDALDARKILVIKVNFNETTATKVIDEVNNHTLKNSTTDEFTPAERPFTASAGGDFGAVGGHVGVRTSNGTLTVSEAVSGAGASNILLEAGTTGDNDKDVVLNAAVQSGGGSVTILANHDILQAAAADITTTGDGTIEIEATHGSITMSDAAADSALATTAGGNIRLLAGIDVNLGGVNAAGGDVSVVAAGGSITDNGDSAVDVTAASLRLVAANGIGTGAGHLDVAVEKIAAQAAGGGVFVTEADGVTVDSIPGVPVNRVAALGSTSTVTDDQALAGLKTTQGSGDLVLVNLAGDLAVVQPVTAHGDGNILLVAVNDLAVQSAIGSTSGNISILAGGDLTQTSTGDIATGDGTVDVQAATGSIAMSAGASAATLNRNIRYQAGANVSLGMLNAGSGNVGVIAGGSISDNDAAALNVSGAEIRLEAADGIGTGSNAIDVAAGTLAASAGADGVFLSEADALTVGEVADVRVSRVQTNGTDVLTPAVAGPNLAGIVAAGGDGSIVLRTAHGSLVVDRAIAAAGLGNVLLQTRTASATHDKDLTLNASVSSVMGNVSLIADRNIVQNVAGDVTAGGAGTIDVQAQNGSVTMNDNGADSAVTTTAGGNIRYVASGNVLVGSLNAGSGDLSVLAGGDILDNGDTLTDLVGANLRLDVAGSVARGSNHLETAVGTLAARAVKGLYLTEGGDLAIDTVSAISVNRVDVDGTVPAGMVQTDSALSEIRITENGNLVLDLTNGTLSVEKEILTEGNGNIRLTAKTTGANDKDIALNAPVTSTTRNVTLIANRNVTQTAAGDVTAGGTLDVEAETGSILMTDGAVSQTQGGAIRLRAAQGVTLGGLIGVDGDVSVTAVAGSIISAGSMHTEIAAGRARLNAGIGIGLGADHLQTAVDVLAARATSGGVFLQDADNLTVDAIGAISVSRVDSNGSTPTLLRQTDAALTEVRTTAGNGAIVLTTADGTLTLNQAVVADGSGAVRLESKTAGANDKDVKLNAAVASETGDISVLANRNIDQIVVGDIDTNGGTIDLLARNGSVNMANGAVTNATTGAIRVEAALNVTLGGLAAAAVSVTATNGAISDGGDQDMDVAAGRARLVAASGIGTGADALETAVTTLAANAGTGGQFYVELDGIAIDTVAAISVNRIDVDGGVASTPTDAALSDLIADGHIVLQTLNGSITVNEGLAPVGGVVSLAGNVLLEARTTAADDKFIQVNAPITATTGSISLLANQNVNQAAAGDLFVGMAGTVDVQAKTGSVTMADGATAATAGGNIRYEAEVDVEIGGLNAPSGTVVVEAGRNVIDGGSMDKDVVAAAVRLVAGNAIGTLADAIDTAVDTAAALSGNGGVFLTDDDDLVVGVVGGAQVGRVTSSGATAPHVDPAAADLVGIVTGATGQVVLTSLAGMLTTVNARIETDLLTATAPGLISLDTKVNEIVASTTANSPIEIREVDGLTAVDIDAGANDVTLTAGGSVTDSDAMVDVQARTLTATVNGGVGTGAHRLQTTVTNLNVDTSMADGDQWLDESNALASLNLDAGTGNVDLLAGGTILDGDMDADVQATTLTVFVDGAFAAGTSADDAIDTDLTHL